MPNPHWQRTLYILFVAQLFTAVGFSSMFPFLPLYVQELGSSTGTSLELLTGLVFSGQAFAMMLVAPVWGTLADRYGRKLMVERAMFGGTIILLLMAFSRSAEQLVVLPPSGFDHRQWFGSQRPEPPSRRASAWGTPGMVQAGLMTGVAVITGGRVCGCWGWRSFCITSALLISGRWSVR
jgi:DHA1 family multidrug resistance protein-like MFS transporter